MEAGESNQLAILSQEQSMLIMVVVMSSQMNLIYMIYGEVRKHNLRLSILFESCAKVLLTWCIVVILAC